MADLDTKRPRQKTSPVQMGMAAATVGGRQPTQQRSRERVERILAVTTELIARSGSDGLKMSEIAEAAEISIGSLYQYFPDKSALLGGLAERYNAEGRACVAALLEPVATAAQLPAALTAVVDGYYAMFRAEPVMRDIWSATQTDKALLALDIADGQAHGDMLAAVLKRLQPRRDSQRLATDAYLLMNLISAAVRLAISVDASEGAAIIASFKRLVLKPAMQALLESGGTRLSAGS